MSGLRRLRNETRGFDKRSVDHHVIGGDGLGNPGHQAARAFARKSAPQHRDFRALKEDDNE